MERIEYLELSAVQILKKEFKEARERLEKGGLGLAEFQQRVIKDNPEWDSLKGGGKIRNAWHGLAADVLLTRIAAAYAAEDNFPGS